MANKNKDTGKTSVKITKSSTEAIKVSTFSIEAVKITSSGTKAVKATISDMESVKATRSGMEAVKTTSSSAEAVKTTGSSKAGKEVEATHSYIAEKDQKKFPSERMIKLPKVNLHTSIDKANESVNTDPIVKANEKELTKIADKLAEKAVEHRDKWNSRDESSPLLKITLILDDIRNPTNKIRIVIDFPTEE